MTIRLYHPSAEKIDMRNLDSWHLRIDDMTIASKITITRFLFLMTGAALLSYGNLWAAMLLWITSYVLDVFDGHIARKLDHVTKFGGALDFLIDKISLFVCLALLVFHASLKSNYPRWLACLIVTQAILQIVLWILTIFFSKDIDRIKTPRTVFGRFVFISQIATIFVGIISNLVHLQAWLTETCYLVAGIGTALILAKDIYIKDYGSNNLR